MTNRATLNADARDTLGDGRILPPPDGGVADLIRHSCRDLGKGLGRHGFRVAAGSLRGRIFFDTGRVVHAEFGEDFGLRAIVEMLRADAKVAGVWTGTWPQQSSVHFGSEVLALVADSEAAHEIPRVDTRVIRRVQGRSEPNLPPGAVSARPLASPQNARAEDPPGHAPGAAAHVARSTPASSVWLRGGSRTHPLSNRVAETLAQRPLPARSSEAAQPGRTAAAAARPPRSEPPPTTAAARPPRPDALAAAVAARPVHSEPPPTTAAARPPRPDALGAAVAARPVHSEPLADAAVEAPARRSESARPSLVRRIVAVKASASAIAAARTARARMEARPPPVAPVEALEDQPTTMVRVSARGEILAARGKHAEQLADAAAYIHGLANLIASDLGRHGRAVVHIQGGSDSMLVLRSEVNDIAAALGPTRRLASLLEKVGIR